MIFAYVAIVALGDGGSGAGVIAKLIFAGLFIVLAGFVIFAALSDCDDSNDDCERLDEHKLRGCWRGVGVLALIIIVSGIIAGLVFSRGP